MSNLYGRASNSSVRTMLNFFDDSNAPKRAWCVIFMNNDNIIDVRSDGLFFVFVTLLFSQFGSFRSLEVCSLMSPCYLHSVHPVVLMRFRNYHPWRRVHWLTAQPFLVANFVDGEFLNLIKIIVCICWTIPWTIYMKVYLQRMVSILFLAFSARFCLMMTYCRIFSFVESFDC